MDTIKSNRAGNPALFIKETIGLLLQEDKQLFQTLRDIAESMGMKVYLVGGYVRDIFLGIHSVDIDIAVIGEGPRFAEEVCRAVGHKIVIYSQFGTALVTMPKRRKLDIVTARKEKYISPGDMPVVSFSQVLDHDAYRRDFTINSMYISLNKENWGDLVDYYDGYRDLQDGLLRVMHDLSFIDDPTRILRALRFQERFHFKLEEKTEYLLRKAITKQGLRTVSVERIRRELDLGICEPKPAAFLCLLERYGIWSALLDDWQLQQSTMIALYKFQEMVEQDNAGLKTINIAEIYWLLLAVNCSEREFEFAGFFQLGKLKRKLKDWKVMVALQNTISLANRRSEYWIPLQAIDKHVIQVAYLLSQDLIVTRRLEEFISLEGTLRPKIGGRDLLSIHSIPPRKITSALNALQAHIIDYGQISAEAELAWVIENEYRWR